MELGGINCPERLQTDSDRKDRRERLLALWTVAGIDEVLTCEICTQRKKTRKIGDYGVNVFVLAYLVYLSLRL